MTEPLLNPNLRPERPPSNGADDILPMLICLAGMLVLIYGGAWLLCWLLGAT